MKVYILELAVGGYQLGRENWHMDWLLLAPFSTLDNAKRAAELDSNQVIVKWQLQETSIPVWIAEFKTTNPYSNHPISAYRISEYELDDALDNLIRTKEIQN